MLLFLMVDIVKQFMNLISTTHGFLDLLWNRFRNNDVPCQTRKPLKQHIISKPSISLRVMTRLQIDLIDMRTRPDVLSPNITFN